MRTQEKFDSTMKQVEWWHRFHKKSVWLVALENTYVISSIKPRPEEIAKGTVANLYDTDMKIIDSVSNL